ncbi:MAG: glycosyltransferase [Bacteroidota bacterium]
MQKPIAVLHLSASDKGGAFVVAANMANHLDDATIVSSHLIFTGLHQNVAITGIPLIDKFIKFVLHALEKLQLMLHEKSKSTRFKFSLGHPGLPYFILKKYIRKADIIHIHWMNKGFINIRDLQKFKKPIVWTTHDIWAVTGGCHLTLGCTNFTTGCGNCPMMAEPGTEDISRYLVNLKRKIYSNINLTLVSPSKWMGFNIANSWLGKDIKQLVIPNGVDTSIFHFKETLTENKLIIGFVAANLNDPNKALYRLIHAITLLKDPNRVKLLLVGNKKAEFDFTIPCEYEIVSGISGAETMAALYQRMDVLAVTSSMETYPTTLMEGACCGTLTIGFNVGGISEIIVPFIGQLIQPFDIPAYALGLQHFCDNRMEKIHVATYAANNFGIQKMGNQYKALYQTLMA